MFVTYHETGPAAWNFACSMSGLITVVSVATHSTESAGRPARTDASASSFFPSTNFDFGQYTGIQPSATSPVCSMLFGEIEAT